MTTRISITKERAKKLVESWEGHNANNTEVRICFEKESNCPIHKFFMELKRKTK